VLVRELCTQSGKAVGVPPHHDIAGWRSDHQRISLYVAGLHPRPSIWNFLAGREVFCVWCCSSYGRRTIAVSQIEQV
jgi:hypothetical protein